MTLDMLVNIWFVLFIGNIFGILAASNIGYVLAHFFAITGFILLRRDRPEWPRPIMLSPVWIPVAWVLGGDHRRAHDLRRRLVPDRRRRLRRHDGEDHRLRRPRSSRSCSSSSAGSSRTACARSGASSRTRVPDAQPGGIDRGGSARRSSDARQRAGRGGDGRPLRQARPTRKGDAAAPRRAAASGDGEGLPRSERSDLRRGLSRSAHDRL